MMSSKTLFCIDLSLQSKVPQAPGISKIKETHIEKTTVFHIIEQTATRRFQDALRSVQEPFKRLQDASTRLPKGLQTPPRTFQERPRHLQDTPKSTPRRLQVRTKRPPGAQEAARDAQEPPKRVQEPPRVPQELSRSTPRSLQERAKRLLKLNPKMLQRL